MELWRTTVSGSMRLQLISLSSNRAFDGVAIVSDGTRLAFVEDEDMIGTGDLDVPAQLILLRSDDSIGSSDFRGGSNGSADTMLAEGNLRVWSNAFSPDDSQIVFVARAEGSPPAPTALWVVDAAYGAVPRRVTPEYPFVSQPAWLDANTLIFSPEQTPNVFTTTLQVDVSATPPQPPEVLFDGGFVALSPDKTMLLVIREPVGLNIAEDQLFPYALVSLAGDTPQILQEWQLPLGEFAWSPDSAMLAQSDIGGVLRLLRLDDGTTEELLRLNPLVENISHLTWSADSRGLIYVFNDTSGDANAPREVYQLDLADGTSNLIVSGANDDFSEVLIAPPASTEP
ncbi:MAG: hypothetical protein MI924_19610 [Chloroflexales bacterium]|nr:hypothetical protein [Chloroflexales bacterium]